MASPFRISGYTKKNKEKYHGFVDILYSETDCKKIQMSVVNETSLESDNRFTIKEEEYELSSSTTRVIGSSEENDILLEGTETWNITSDLELDPTYTRIRKMYGDGYFEALGTDWKFQYRYIIQDDELFIIATQSHATGIRVKETDDYAFRVNLEEKTFKYLGATPRGEFRGILY